MERSFRRIAFCLIILTLGLAGCNGEHHPPYSSAVKYGLRKDPVVRGQAAKLGDERYEPDRPGIFPLMKMSDLKNPDHPYHAKASEINDQILRDPTLVSAEHQKELETGLEAIFGTPAHPSVNAKEAGVDAAWVTDLKLDDTTLAKGSRHYRVHCLHCHGVPGDGRGPTAKWINPHPRDFRKGYFKFQSVDRVAVGGAPRRPSRADLVRTLRQGIEGTAMPSFAILPDAELETIVSYVIHLSVRGYAELTTLDEGFSLQGGALKPAAKIKDSVNDYTFAGLKVWHAANQPEAAIKVAAYPYDANDHVALKASAKRGQAIFNAVPTPEVTTGLGKILRVNAAQSKKNEDAAQQKVKDATEKKRKDALAKNPKMTKEELEAIVPDESETKLTDKELAALRLTAKEREAAIAADAASSEQVAVKLIGAPKCVSCHKNYGREALYRFDDWGTLVRPNNLYTGNLRGGKRPVDIYYRVHSGINGSGMTPFGSDYMGNEFLIWDVVNFVQALPHPAMRKALDLNID